MKKLKYRLIAIDIDGTLLNKDKKIDKPVYDAIMMYQDIGGKIILASGRSPNSTKWISKILNTNEAIIAFNGAYVEDYKGNIITYNRFYENEILNILLLCQQYHLETIVYTSTNMYIEKISTLNKRWLNDVLSFDYLNVSHSLPNIKKYMPNIIIDKFNEDFKNINTKDILKIVILPNKINEFEKIAVELKKLNKYELNKTPRYIEITKSNADKYDALQKICEQHNVDLKDVLAIGDNYNDLKMIKEVGFGIAMENGVEIVRKSAKKVVSSNSNLGVKEAIELYGMEGEF